MTRTLLSWAVYIVCAVTLAWLVIDALFFA